MGQLRKHDDVTVDRGWRRPARRSGESRYRLGTRAGPEGSKHSTTSQPRTGVAHSAFDQVGRESAPESAWRRNCSPFRGIGESLFRRTPAPRVSMPTGSPCPPDPYAAGPDCGPAAPFGRRRVRQSPLPQPRTGRRRSRPTGPPRRRHRPHRPGPHCRGPAGSGPHEYRQPRQEQQDRTAHHDRPTHVEHFPLVSGAPAATTAARRTAVRRRTPVRRRTVPGPPAAPAGRRRDAPTAPAPPPAPARATATVIPRSPTSAITPMTAASPIPCPLPV